ncbi:MAG: sulfotransferase [Chloroflexota bacterium]|nr:sulfotransferase [Chloroflexota bacterium]
MLGTHSDVVTIPEFQTKIDIIRRLPTNGVDPGSAHDIAGSAGILLEFVNDWRLKDWGIDLKEAAASLSPEIWKRASHRVLIERFVDQYGMKNDKSHATLWVDHTPSNSRFAATLLDLFPDAKMLHIVRDGRAIASSVMRLDWGPNTVLKAAPWWVERVAYGLAAETLWGVERVMRVTYEGLVADPAPSLQKICHFLGIDYQPRMVEANGFTVPQYTASQHTLIGSPPRTDRINAWESILTARQVEIFESRAGSFLHQLGYEACYGLQARQATNAERASLHISELCHKWIINKTRYLARRRLAH